MTNTNLVLFDRKTQSQTLALVDKPPSVNSMKSLETEKAVVNEPLSEVESVNLTEWLIFKIKIIYGRPIFEGDSPEEASAIRHEWQDLVLKIGKNGVLATIDFLLSGHHAVPSFPPSSVEFRKCYRTYTSPAVIKETYQEKEP